MLFGMPTLIELNTIENTVEVWLSSIFCPIIRVDGTLPIENNAELLGDKLGNRFELRGEHR